MRAFVDALHHHHNISIKDIRIVSKQLKHIYVIDVIDIYFIGSFYGFVMYQGLIKIVSQVI